MSRLTTNAHVLLTNDIIQLLYSKNIYTVTDFLKADIKQLLHVLRLEYKDVINIRNHLQNKNSAVIRNASDIYHEFLLNSANISTGIASLDKLLCGGLNTGNIYEICGQPNSGKTQLCLTIAKHVSNTLEQHVFYLDAKHDFSARRLKNMLEGNEQIGEIMERILTSKVSSLHELINILYAIRDNFKSYNLRLVIIDSLPALLYQYSNIQEGYGLLNHAVNVMRLLMSQFHIVFLVTNVMTTWIGNIKEESELSQCLGCGKYWFNIPNVRLKIQKRLVDYEISILKSTYLADDKCFVKITSAGVVDL